MAIARHWHGKHLSVATNAHNRGTVRPFLGNTVFSRRSMLRLYNDSAAIKRHKVNHVKSIKRITWTLSLEMTEAKAFRTFIRTYSPFKSEHLSTNIKLTLYKALITSVMSYACPAWEVATDTHLLKLQRLQNNVLHTTGNFPRCTLACNLHTDLNLPYVRGAFKF
jgi:hypothetical protein